MDLKTYIKNIFLIILIFLLAHCSSDPQPSLKISLVVDKKEKLAISAYGDEVDILQEKHADLINLMDRACNSKDLSREDKKRELQLLIQHLKTNFAAEQKVIYEIESNELVKKLVQTVIIDVSNNETSCRQKRSRNLY
jgi:uncharacterized protein YcfL